MAQKISDAFDSKFRFILVASERAKQLQNGAPTMINTKSRKPAFIAIRETEADLVPWSMLEESEETPEEEQ